MTRMENQQGYLHSVFVSVEGEGTGVGIRTLFLRLAGCSVGCAYCDTKSSWDPHPETWTLLRPKENLQVPNPTNAGDVIGFVQPLTKLQVRRINLTGGEPLQQLEFTQSLTHLLHHKLDLPCILETSGLFPEELGFVLDDFNQINLDIKLPSLMDGQENWDLYFRSLKIAANSFLQVKLVVADNSTDDEIQQATRIISEVESFIPLVLQPVCKSDAFSPPNEEQLMRWQEIGLQRLLDVRVIPQIHKMLNLP